METRRGGLPAPCLLPSPYPQTSPLSPFLLNRPPGRRERLQLPTRAVDAAVLRALVKLAPLRAAVVRHQLRAGAGLEDREAAGAEVIPVLLAVRVVAGGAGAEADG